MVCEGLFRLYGTSSKEIIERAKEEEAAFYQPKIDALSSANSELTSTNNELTSFINELTSTIDALHSKINTMQNLLIQNNISFDSET